MNIAILVPVRVGGCGGFIKHLSELVPRWKFNGRVSKVTIVVPVGVLGMLETLGVELVQVPRDDYRTGFRRMGELVRNGKYDVILNTFTRPVNVKGARIVTMVQNVEPIQAATYAMPLLWRLRLHALRRENAVACRQANRVIAVSRHVKDEVCRRFHIDQGKVDVVYHGFDAAEATTFCKPDLQMPDGGFLFGAGSFVPYRGFEDIIRSLAEIRSRGGHVPHAVFAGSGTGIESSCEQSMKRLSKTLHVDDKVIWAGQLKREEMSWCYRNAGIFIQSSRAESFSNIQLEAIGHGCLCISGNNPPMPEILAEAASYYHLGDIRALASEIQKTLALDEKERGNRREGAKLRASFFSWEKTSEQTLDVLERAVRNSN